MSEDPSKLLRWMTWVLLGLGLVLILMASNLPLPGLIPPGIVLLGAGLITAGVETALSRRMRFLEKLVAYPTHWGGVAMIWSFVFTLSGVALVYLGGAALIGAADAFSAYLRRQPGVPMLTIGFAVGGTGLALILGPHEWRGSWQTILRSLPQRFIGLFLLVIGLALLTLGSYALLLPAEFQNWIQP